MAVKTNCTKNGKEYYRVTATVGKKTDGKPIRKEFYGKSKKEAEQKRDNYLKSIEGLDIDYENVTLESMIYMWIWEVIKPQDKIKDSTFERYESIYRNYIKNSQIANIKLSEVKPIHIQKYYNEIYDIKKSVSLVHAIHVKLNMFFNYCVNNDLIQKNPVSNKRVTIPGKTEYKSKEVETFSKEEIDILKKNLIGHHLEMLILLALGTGLRQGELLGLYWNDIDFDNCCLSVNKSLKGYTEINKDGTRKYVNKIRTPKTESSIRIVPIPNSLIVKLKQFKLKEKEKFFKNGVKFKEDYFVFTSTSCNYYSAQTIYQSYTNLLRRLNIKHKKFHALRHTYATQLFKLGTPIMTVSKLLGHTSLETTEIYTHILHEQKEDAVNRLDELFK